MTLLIVALAAATLAAAQSASDNPEIPQLLLFRSTFSALESARIAATFEQQLTAESDTRSISNLPRMADDYSVARLNRFDEGGSLQAAGTFDWIYERVVEQLRASRASVLGDDESGDVADGAAWLRSLLEFNLMHEFDAHHSRFDWHVDTKPGDGSHRTYNINVMLSAPEEYVGGVLQVGATSLSPGIGDLYMYPASTPHAVTPVTAGRRRTLVIALRAPLPPDAPLSAAYAAAAAATRAAAAAGVVAGAARIPRGEEEEAVPSRVAYWAAAEKTFRELCEGPLAAEPKVHLLRGEFLEASQSPAAAKRAFCDSYRAHGRPAAAAFAQAFMSDGVAALAAPATGASGGDGAARLRSYSLAVEYLEMAFCIAPDTPDLEEGLAEVRRARDAMLAAAAPGAGHRDEL